MDDSNKRQIEEKKVRFRLNLLDSKKEKKNWILFITFLSFMLSASLNYLSSLILSQVSLIFANFIVLFIIFFNIFFDIIGTAVTAADEAPFHAMASRKLYGSRQAIRLIRNADKVSNFCNDVIGDICGIISGAATAFILLSIIQSNTQFIQKRWMSLGIELFITGLVAALTVGGKALGKIIAIENSNSIIFKVAVVIKFLTSRLNFKSKRKSAKGRV